MAARRLEIEFFGKLGVYRKVHKSAAKGHKVISTRWVDTNKGEEKTPDYRSRLVGREINTQKRLGLFAATPPFDALRIIINNAATCLVMIKDVRRAYLYAKITRDVYIELPKEDPKYGTGLLGKLKLCLNGTRDAAKR